MAVELKENGCLRSREWPTKHNGNQSTAMAVKSAQWPSVLEAAYHIKPLLRSSHPLNKHNNR
jgi:hypothetical protein